jgi:cyclophilin family peptidyl-prolyl cis-trans isomerase
MVTMNILKMMKKFLTISIIFASVLFLSSCTSGGEKMNIAKFETNMGYFKVQLFTEEMPITTKNFIDLAKKGFYDGSRFHRIIGPRKAPPSGFMIQGGDPLSKDVSKSNMWGTGGPGYNIKDEFTDNNKNDAGTISMANSGPDTGGSQFFINLGDNNFLDDKHPVFGKVIEGMNIIKKIGNVNTNMGDQPLEDVIIEKITIE